MRIIGGTLKGRAIFPPSGFKARPTTDFAKEGLFNMLDNAYDLSTMRVLDLFSGTRQHLLRICLQRSAGDIFSGDEPASRFVYKEDGRII